jgi:dTMP kinase
MRGLLIAFDGLDSSGKATQVLELEKRLEHLGYRVRHFETPDYTTPSGVELKARLQGSLGEWSTTPWDVKMRYFSRNRAEHKEEVLAALAAGDMVVYDRYVGSSLAFITAEALNTQEIDLYRQEVHETIRREEYVTNGMPEENVAIFLDVPPDIASVLLDRRKNAQGDADEYSDHIALQQRLYKEYDELIRDKPELWLRIKCTQGSELLSIDAVSELVWEGLIRKFPALRK